MVKRLVAALLAVGLTFLLAGCSSLTFQNVNELLRAPELGQGLDEIQKALKAYLGGEEPQYKFPRGGDWRSPLIRTDLNNDGREEAILLYSVPEASAAYREKGGNVYIAVLEQIENVWTVVQDIQGLSTEVLSLEVANLLGDGSRQLIVCYANANLTSRVFALYQYLGLKLLQTHQFSYSRYEIGDFTGRGSDTLVLVSGTEQSGGLLLYYLSVKKDAFVPESQLTPVKLDVNFVSCVGISPSAAPGGGHLLVVDGHMSTDTGALASQFVYYSAENDLFYTTDDFNALRSTTSRLSPLLKSRDVDNDGIVEIPQLMRSVPVLANSGIVERELDYVEWVDFTDAEPVRKQYGLMDPDRGLYVRFPQEWYGKVEILSGEKSGEWHVQNRASQKLLLSLRSFGQGEMPPVGASRVPGTTNYYLLIDSGVSTEDRQQISWFTLS